eukprot:Pgem_evm1s11579
MSNFQEVQIAPGPMFTANDYKSRDLQYPKQMDIRLKGVLKEEEFKIIVNTIEQEFQPFWAESKRFIYDWKKMFPVMFVTFGIYTAVHCSKTENLRTLEANYFEKAKNKTEELNHKFDFASRGLQVNLIYKEEEMNIMSPFRFNVPLIQILFNSQSVDATQPPAYNTHTNIPVVQVKN